MKFLKMFRNKAPVFEIPVMPDMDRESVARLYARVF